jgi:hypothetical protein
VYVARAQVHVAEIRCVISCELEKVLGHIMWKDRGRCQWVCLQVTLVVGYLGVGYLGVCVFGGFGVQFLEEDTETVYGVRTIKINLIQRCSKGIRKLGRCR